MASPATVTIPMVDLQILSQDDLASLALSCPNAFDLHRCDDVVLPKIDRSVFNESAGSRKQTYSHLRPAPHKSNPSATSASSVVRLAFSSAATPCNENPALEDDRRGSPDDPGHRENILIVSYLRQLFSGREPSSSQTLTQFPSIPVPNNNPDVGRKDGKRAQEACNTSTALAVARDNRDREVMNQKGEVLDLVALGQKEEPFAEALLQRTAGMKTEEQLLGFMGGIDGQWGSRRRRRRIVDAALFGDHLPKGWKLLLGLKRKEGYVWVYCRRYISPSGKHFLSCKEVSIYALSLIGSVVLPISTQNDGNIIRTDNFVPHYPAGSTTVKSVPENHTSSVAPTSITADSNNQIVLFEAENQAMKRPNVILVCQGCNLSFGDKSALLQHTSSCYRRSTKRRKIGKLICEGFILKDGKYECQFCHKIFEERHRYNGHIGAHVRYQGLTAEGMPDKTSLEKIYNPCPLSAVPYCSSDKIVQEKEDTAKGNLACGPHSTSSEYKDNHENESRQDLKLDYPKLSITSKHVDEQNIDFNDIRNNSEEIVQSSNTLIEMSNALAEAVPTMGKFDNDPNNVCDTNVICRENVLPQNDAVEESASADVATLPATFAESVIQYQSAVTAQEESEKKSVANNSRNNHTTDHILEDSAKPTDLGCVISDNCEVSHSDLVGHKSKDAFEATKLNLEECSCDNTVNMANITTKPTIDIFLSSSISTSAHGKTNDFDVVSYVPEVTVEATDAVSTVGMADMNSELEKDIGQSDTICSPIAVKAGNLDTISYMIEITDGNNTYMEVKANDCQNSISTCLESANITDCENSVGANADSIRSVAEVKEYAGVQKLDSVTNFLTLTDDSPHFAVENCSIDIFRTGLDEDNLDQMATSRKTVLASSQTFHVKDATASSAMTNELNANCFSMPFAGVHASSRIRNVESKFDIEMKEDLFGGMDQPGNGLDGCFRDSHVRVEVADASNNIQHDDQINHLQVDLSLTSPWAHSSNSIPFTEMISNQECQNASSSDNQKHNNFFGFGQLGLGPANSSTFLSLTNQEQISGPAPNMQLGYGTELGNRNSSPVDLGWGLSLPSSAPQLTSICMWCNREFTHPINNAADKSDSLGFICPTCKAKITGKFGMLGAGSFG